MDGDVPLMRVLVPRKFHMGICFMEPTITDMLGMGIMVRISGSETGTGVTLLPWSQLHAPGPTRS